MLLQSWETGRSVTIACLRFVKHTHNHQKNGICCFMHILDNMDYKYGIKNEVLNVDANYIKIRLPNWVLKIRKELTSIFVKPFNHFL